MLAKIQEQMDVWSKRLSWLPPTLARLALGITFLTAGWGKLGALDAAITNFRDNFHMPIPEITAPFVSGVELVGGILVLAGLLTRFAAIALMINMLVAVFAYWWSEVADKLNLFGLAESGYIIMSAWLAVTGAGPLSLDRLLGKKLTRPAST